MKNYILIRNSILIKPFEKNFINKKFIQILNDKKNNQYLDIGKKKQTKKTAENYFYSMKKNGNLYSAIFDNKKKNLIGTITLRKINKNDCYIGFLIGNNSYKGSKVSQESISLYIYHIFKKLKFIRIKAKTYKDNMSSNFCLTNNSFVLNKKDKKFFYFSLNKNKFKKKYKYKFHESN